MSSKNYEVFPSVLRKTLKAASAESSAHIKKYISGNDSLPCRSEMRKHVLTLWCLRYPGWLHAHTAKYVEKEFMKNCWLFISLWIYEIIFTQWASLKHEEMEFRSLHSGEHSWAQVFSDSFLTINNKVLFQNLNFIKRLARCCALSSSSTFLDEISRRNNESELIRKRRNSREDGITRKAEGATCQMKTYCFSWEISWRTLRPETTHRALNWGLLKSEENDFLRNEKELKLHFQYLTVFNIFIKWKKFPLRRSSNSFCQASKELKTECVNRCVSHASQQEMFV